MAIQLRRPMPYGAKQLAWRRRAMGIPISGAVSRNSKTYAWLHVTMPRTMPKQRRKAGGHSGFAWHMSVWLSVRLLVLLAPSPAIRPYVPNARHAADFWPRPKLISPLSLTVLPRAVL